MARRKASPSAWAKAVGASLIGLGLLIGLSLIPHQTAAAPEYLAKRLGQGLGAGVVALPALCLLLGLIFVVRDSFRLSARVSGILVGYLACLVLLHLRYAAGHEFLAASGRKGGGYVGAALVSVLRWAVGESGLWTGAILGATASVLLISGLSFTQALRGMLLLGRSLGDTLGRAGLRLGTWGGAAVLTGVRGLFMARGGVEGDPASHRPRGGAQAAPNGEAGSTGTAPPATPRREPEDVGVRSILPMAAAPADRLTAQPASPLGHRRKPLIEQELLPLLDERDRAYTLPPLSLLDAFPSGKARAGKADPEEVARSLERTLGSFGVEAKVVRWETGPVVTRYELQPAPGVKVQKITSLQNDIALALAASSVRLEAPIPGKSAIGVELPNERPGLVHLREILMSEEFQSSTSPLSVAIGKGIAGKPIVADIEAMPHVLIAGATGAGKSVAINSMIASILFRATPEQVRFLMIDPKRVELTNYNGIPHLLSPVVTAPREAAAKLRWAIQEMESRYETFAAEGVRNIQAFNAQHPDRPLASILIIVDELADLMMVAPADFEEIICRLAQMTRATGIHLLVATQRPSVDVITGLIKANIPSRIAFAVTSQVDSRTILDHPGAERLLGKGDMLFAPIGATRPTRVQGSYISDAETERLVEFWRAQRQPTYLEELVHAGDEPGGEETSGDDALLADAARIVVRIGYASVSLLQRKMRIGYVRAARLVDQMEARGIVGPAQGSSPREVLAALSDLDRIFRSGSPRHPWAGASGAEEG